MDNKKIARILASITEEQWEAILIVSNKMTFTALSQIKNAGEVEKKESTPKELEIKVRELLKEIGILPNLYGFDYLSEAIILVYKDNTYIHQVTKALYPTIAKKYVTTTHNVESAITNALDKAFKLGNYELHKKIFKYTSSDLIEGKLHITNTKAISAITDYIKVNE